MRSPPALEGRWRRALWRSAAAALIVVASGATASAEPPTSNARKKPPETVEVSGAILGVEIGMQISEARAKLDRLREPVELEPDAKERENKRVYWKLKETEYEWLIAWANSKGEVTRLRARLREGSEKRFSDIGDLTRAAVNTPEQAMWNVTAPGRPAFRLIAQGKDRRAVTFYMFALNLEMR